MAAVELSAAARRQAEWALLNEILTQLEEAQGEIMALRDAPEGLNKWPLTADARSPLNWIAQGVEALDALGWQEAIDRGPAERERKAEGGES